MNGFLGTGATFRADLNLVVQILMGIALLYGMYLARRRKFKAHKYCQSLVMILNLVMISLIMVPSFHKQVQPQVPGGLKETYYLVAYLHAMLGAIAEVLGLYIVLVAATKIVPPKLRFKRYKPWMRTELAIWWLVTLFGIGTYFVWYIKGTSVQPRAATEASQATQRVSVNISNFQFEPKDLTIKEGTIVEWTDERGRHTVQADDGSFKSETLTAGGTFQFKFDKPGVYPYYCELHGDKHGKDMAGTITVEPRGK